jgi:hypothetical protein
MYLLAEKYTCSLSVLIQKEYNKLITALAQIPYSNRATKLIKFTGGMVCVADIIAYQIGWGKLLIYWYKTGKENTIPVMPGEGFTSWDYTGLAQLFYKKYQYDSAREQEREFYNTVQEIIAFTEHEYKTGNLDKLGVWPWCTLASGKQWTLGKWIKINTAAPYKRARLTLNNY